MTINSEARVAGPFDGNDSTVSFPFTFKVFDSDEVRVVAETGAVETDLELGTDYTVTLNADQNAAPGGSVVLVAPLPTGTRLTLTSALEMLQPVDLTNQGGFYPRVINSALDRLTILLQQLASVVSRTLKFPLSDGPVGDLPGRSARAGTVLAFDEATGEPVAGPDIASVNGVVGALVAINTVSDNIVDVNTVAADIINVNTVAADIANVNTVAGSIVDVNTVAGNITDVTNFADVYYGPSATPPTTRRDGSPLQVGDLYFDTPADTLRVYDGAAWREAAGGSIAVQNFSGDGSTVAFTLDTAPASASLVQVFIDGVYQHRSTYSVSGTTLTFNVAPPTGTDNIEVTTTSVVPSDDVLRGELAAPGGVELIGGAYQAVDSIAALRLLDKTAAPQHAVVTGYYAAGDGGGGVYYLDAADTTTADNSGSVIVAADGARWKLTNTDAQFTAEQFGAVGDGVTNDQAAIQAALNALPAGGGTVLLRKRYVVDTDITLPANSRLCGTWSPFGAHPWPGVAVGTEVHTFTCTILLNPAASINMSAGSQLEMLSVLRKGMTVAEADSSLFAGTAIKAIGIPSLQMNGIRISHCQVIGFAQLAYFEETPRMEIEYVSGDNIAGLRFGTCYDVVRVKNCHMWPYSSDGIRPTLANYNRSGSAYYFATRNDIMQLEGLFSYGYYRGIHFGANIGTATVVNCHADGTALLANSIGFLIEGDCAYTTFVGCSSYSNDHGYWQTANAVDNITYTNCRAIGNLTQGWHIEQGNALLVNCLMAVSNKGITVQNASSSADIRNCSFASHTLVSIEASLNGTVRETGNKIDDTAPVGGWAIPVVAAADPLVLPQTGSLFSISGAATFGTLNNGWAGRQVTLVFQGIVTVNGGGNMQLSGGNTFTSKAGSTLTLVHTGAGGKWYEVCRAAN